VTKSSPFSRAAYAPETVTVRRSRSASPNPAASIESRVPQIGPCVENAAEISRKSASNRRNGGDEGASHPRQEASHPDAKAVHPPRSCARSAKRSECVRHRQRRLRAGSSRCVWRTRTRAIGSSARAIRLSPNRQRTKDHLPPTRRWRREPHARDVRRRQLHRDGVGVVLVTFPFVALLFPEKL
jgi:hypothetical protein